MNKEYTNKSPKEEVINLPIKPETLEQFKKYINHRKYEKKKQANR